MVTPTLMKTTILHALRLLLTLVMTGTLQAGTATGNVTWIQVNNYSNAVLFSLNTSIEKTPKCNERNQFAIDLLQPAGNAIYQLLLDARRYGYVITVNGLNTCAVFYEAEGVKTIDIN